MKNMPAHDTIDSYITSFPEETRERLKTLRALFKKHAPEATEAISYGIAGYKLYGKVFLYFGGFEKYVSIYPRTAGVEKALGKKLDPYASGKGTLQFPHNKPLPVDLIEEILQARLEEHNLKYRKMTK